MIGRSLTRRLELGFRKRQQEDWAYQPYRGVEDEPLFLAGKFYLARAAGSREYFDRLRRMVELPTFRRFERR